MNLIDPTGEVGKIIRYGRNLAKAKGNPIKAGIETGAGIADNVGTLLDGQINVDDAGAIVDLVTGLDKKDQKAIGVGVKEVKKKLTKVQRKRQTKKRRQEARENEPMSEAQVKNETKSMTKEQKREFHDKKQSGEEDRNRRQIREDRQDVEGGN